jgi:hypothetical protein
MIAVRPLRLAGAVFDSLLPPVCAACGVAVEPGRAPICGACEVRLPRIPLPRCPRCGFTRLADLSSPGRCGECEAWPEQLQRAESAFLHEPPAEALVHGLKYRGWTLLAARMGALMAPAARRLAGGPAVLVPVPLARRRAGSRNRLASQAGIVSGPAAPTAGHVGTCGSCPERTGRIPGYPFIPCRGCRYTRVGRAADRAGGRRDHHRRYGRRMRNELRSHGSQMRRCRELRTDPAASSVSLIPRGSCPRLVSPARYGSAGGVRAPAGHVCPLRFEEKEICR